MSLADEGATLGYLHTAVSLGHARFVGDYLILFDVGCDWYSAKLILFEQIIIRVYREGQATLDDAIAVLDRIAAEYSCSAIAVGDSQRGYMVEAYQRHGYTVSGTTLLKQL